MIERSAENVNEKLIVCPENWQKMFQHTQQVLLSLGTFALVPIQAFHQIKWIHDPQMCILAEGSSSVDSIGSCVA